MPATRDSGNHGETAQAVLAALADRPEEGMTVFEIRANVDTDIDAIEEALAELKDADDIDVKKEGSRTVIVPDDRALERLKNGSGDHTADEESTLLDEIRRRFPF